MNKSDIKIHDIDHLGIIAGIIDEIGLVEQVNYRLRQHPLEIVSPGQAVKAMIINGLGFVSAPLYLFEQFFVGKATEHLIGEGILPEHLNDDRMGRVLDSLYETGLTDIFIEIALKAVKLYGVGRNSVHLDSTSFAVHGEYKREEEGNGEIHITHGYSKEHRPDLKQFVVDLICNSDGDIPMYFRIGNGNEADKAVFGKLMKEFKDKLDFETLFVADSALYSQDNLETMKGMQWLTRVPATIKETRTISKSICESDWKESSIQGYRTAKTKSNYGGIEQRWIVVESEKRKQSDIEQMKKKINDKAKQAQKELRGLSQQVFACEADARGAARRLEQSWRYHQLGKVNIKEQAKKGKRGRPKKETAETEYDYILEATLEENSETIAQEKESSGKFVLATNILEQEIMSDDDLLRKYKEQQSTERGFRFLKDPLFFTSSVFLKTPSRIAALAMVMGLALLVYSLGQRKLRQTLAQTNQSVKNQLKKPTQTPTLRWIFQCFQSIHLVISNNSNQISNLTEDRKYILQLLGNECKKYYLLI